MRPFLSRCMAFRHGPAVVERQEPKRPSAGSPTHRSLLEDLEAGNYRA